MSSVFYSVCMGPIVLGVILEALLVFLILDLPILLFWCLTCGFFGRACPLKFSYTNELNRYDENDERIVACKESRSRSENWKGVVTYGEWKNPIYYGRGRPCKCNLCLCFPCYQDLHGKDAESDAADARHYPYYYPSYIENQESDDRAGMSRCYRVYQ